MAELKDMSIPESFHRVKRTLILLCAAMVLLEWAVPSADGNPDLKLGLFDLHLPMVVARVSLWGAATYYLIGFWLELQTVRRLNTRLMLAGANDYSQALLRLSNDLTTPGGLTRVDALATRVDAMISSKNAWKPEAFTPQEISDAIEFVAGEETSSGALPFGARKLGEKTLAHLSSHPLSGGPFVTQQWDEVRGELKEAVAQYQRLADALSTAHRDMTKLDPEIIRARRIHFFFWEGGGAFAMYGLAFLAVCHGLFFK